MVPPKEQNLRPVEAPAFEEKTQNSDKEEKSYSGIEEKEDFNRS
jgi:hypothetical protein